MANGSDNTGKPPPRIPQITPVGGEARQPPRVTAPTIAPVVPPQQPGGTPLPVGPATRPVISAPRPGVPPGPPPRPGTPTIGAPSFVPPPGAPPTAAAPRVAAPVVAAPRVAPPVVAPPVVAAPRVAPPVIAPPAVAAPRVAPPVIAPPVIAAPAVAPPRVAAPVIAPPVIAAPAVAPPVVAARPALNLFDEPEPPPPPPPAVSSSPSGIAPPPPAARVAPPAVRTNPIAPNGAIEALTPQQSAELRALAQSLEQLDYFGVLCVTQSATPGDIKKAFYRESRTYHPDRFFHLPDSQEKTDLGTLYKRITEAYYVLRDDTKRKKYVADIVGAERTAKLRYTEATESELKAEARKSVDEEFGNHPKSRPFFKSALADIDKQNWASAERNLKMGLTYDRDNARFKEKLVEVQAKLEEHRRSSGEAFKIK